MDFVTRFRLYLLGGETRTAYNSNTHNRHSIRISGYDYASPGFYFVTICTNGRECFLGEIHEGSMQLSPTGEIVRAAWEDLPNHYHHARLDEFILMPNHVHGIIKLLRGSVGAGSEPAPTCEIKKRHPLSEIVRSFKTFSARRINVLRHSFGNPVWQRNYYEHIIRNEIDLSRTREYIRLNPSNWQSDEENPVNN